MEIRGGRERANKSIREFKSEMEREINRGKERE